MRTGFYKFILLLGDVVIFYLSLGLALAVRRPQLFSADYYLLHAAVFSYVLPGCLIINAVLSLYNFRQIMDLSAIIGESLLAFFYNFLISIVIFYFLGPGLPAPKTYLFLTLFLSLVLGVSWRRLWMQLSSSKLFAAKILFLGDNALIKQIIGDLDAHKYSRYRLVHPEALERWQKKHADGKGTKLSEIVDLIVVSGDKAEVNQTARDILTYAVDNSIPVWTHVDFYEEIYKKILPSSVPWLLIHIRQRRHTAYLAVKSVFDVMVAGLLILCLLPLLPFIALAIKLTDGGSIFYSQIRAGHLKKDFRLWKFRTMRVGADKLGYLWNTEKGDPRVTNIGKLLRKFKLDELPQLWNIFNGDMSLVGPRPTWVGEKQAWDMPDYHLRLLVKPGLTGWAQINASATDSEADTFEKLCYDLYYIKNVSLALDLSILLKTVRRVFQSDNYLRQKRRETAAKI
jgi:exopolysaccharide biosynthesis polyprenyl glycosylphosphotransferase